MNPTISIQQQCAGIVGAGVELLRVLECRIPPGPDQPGCGADWLRTSRRGPIAAALALVGILLCSTVFGRVAAISMAATGTAPIGSQEEQEEEPKDGQFLQRSVRTPRDEGVRRAANANPDRRIPFRAMQPDSIETAARERSSGHRFSNGLLAPMRR